MHQEAVLNLATVVHRKADLIATELEEITIMFVGEREKYYGFEAVGSRIWQLLGEPMSVKALCGLLQAEFDVSAEQCERETLDFVRHLHAEGLIVIVD